jgi:hypothetical protein
MAVSIRAARFPEIGSLPKFWCHFCVGSRIILKNIGNFSTFFNVINVVTDSFADWRHWKEKCRDKCSQFVQMRLFNILFLLKLRKSAKAVALQLYYFSKVSARLLIIQHEHAVRTRSKAQLFGCTIWLAEWSGILGYLTKLLMLFLLE